MAAKKNILIVEDDADFAETLSTALSLKMHQVSVANNGHDALEMAMKEIFDTCVLDIKMPGMSGFECLDELKKLLPATTKHIIMTGFRDSETLQQAAQSAAAHVILKPFSIYELLRLIEDTP